MFFNFNIDKILGSLRLNNWFNKNNSPSTKTTIKGNFIGGDLIAGDKYNISEESKSLLSDIEKKVLKLLHISYKQTQLVPRKKIIDVNKELEIKDGMWVGPLNDSSYLKMDGEYIAMTPNGLRYMENLSKESLDKIILPQEQVLLDEVVEVQRRRFEENRKNNLKNSSK